MRPYSPNRSENGGIFSVIDQPDPSFFSARPALPVPGPNRIMPSASLTG